MKRRIHSFVWGGLAALILIIIGIVTSVNTNDYINLAFWGVVGILAFTLISCLILDNNFVGDMVLEIFSWGFVKMPGLIFTLDLDGIIWLLTVKLLFWILGFILAIICGILAIALGLVVSVFVYPFAIYKNVKGIE
ncbi:MAG: hypothetical protein II984_06075 [Clostridia bacterium]|nr:hypothetical protein [Clostridia bacterium]